MAVQDVCGRRPHPARAQRRARRAAQRAGALAAALALALGPTHSALAGGYFIQEQSAKGVGRAFAGQSALVSDGSSLFFNPASAAHLDGVQLGFGGYWIAGDLDLSDRGSTVTTPGLGGNAAPVGGGNGDDAIGAIPLASLYAVFPLQDEQWRAGVSLSAPFGLRTDYGGSWFGRYDSTRSELRSLDVAPTLAYALAPDLSIGASVSIQYAEAKLGSALPNPLAAPSPASDARLEIEGDDWSVGVNVGLLYEPSSGLRIGAAYRSGIEHDLDGRAEFSGLSGPLAAGNGQFHGSAALHLPDIALFGVAFDATPRLTLLGQFNWFNWSEFQEIRVELDDGRDLVSPQEYRDSSSAALGLEYRASFRWTLRAGMQFDRSPVHDGARSSRVPDGDRTWASVGFSYLLRPGVEVDFGYAHIWVRDAELDRTDRFFEGTPLASSARTRAATDSGIDVLALQLNYSF